MFERINFNNLINIRVSPYKTVQHIINLFKLKTKTVEKDNEIKFIFSGHELNHCIRIVDSGLIDVIEDNEQKDIKLLIFIKGGILQKKIDDSTVTLVRYTGFLNSQSTIEYDENYFKNPNNNNSLLKEYERHLNELENIF